MSGCVWRRVIPFWPLPHHCVGREGPWVLDKTEGAPALSGIWAFVPQSTMWKMGSSDPCLLERLPQGDLGDSAGGAPAGWES